MSAATKSKVIPTPSGTESFAARLAPFRTDITWAASLAVITILIWCTVYNRWSPETWQIPIFYPHLVFNESLVDQDLDMSRADVMQQFAIIKAASQGHIL